MGAPLPPNAIMTMHWALKSEMRELPGDPAMEAGTAYWIDELSAWIAADKEEAAIIRDATGAEARIILAKNLPCFRLQQIPPVGR